MAHRCQAPVGLPDGPAADAAEAVTLQLVALLMSLRERIAALEDHIAQALAVQPKRPGCMRITVSNCSDIAVGAGNAGGDEKRRP